ncbi:MAG TPA: ribosome assembly RNA-binding protein YhbY [Gammaproteobacteria bacterium]|nr:ribosome assembly RNA-binding protein YhbY [Gammaproteobacteria bacterium]
MDLSGKQIKHLRALAHHLKPVVTIGVSGVTPAVASELEYALISHELVKIRLPSLPKNQKRALLERVCSMTDSDPVQLIGRIGVAFRGSPARLIKLP